MSGAGQICSWRRVCSPLGDILLAADEIGLTGLWFDGQKYFPGWPDASGEEKALPVLAQGREWLDIYFSGREPLFTPPLHFTGTAFQNAVWEALLAIPYGQTVSYGEITRRLGKPSAAARATGAAVGRNRISIIVPCHRVVGADGGLTGYAGGIERKAALLRLEGAWDKRSRI